MTALPASRPRASTPVDLVGVGALARRIRLLEQINAAWTTQALATAAELCIPDFLADAPADIDALARATACDPHALRRLLRALASLDIVAERADGRFALTAT